MLYIDTYALINQLYQFADVIIGKTYDLLFRRHFLIDFVLRPKITIILYGEGTYKCIYT